MFKIDCPFCGQRIEVPDELDGDVSNCPGCGNEVYFSREDAVEDLDPAVEKIRREHAAAESRHQAELRAVMMMQDRARQQQESTQNIINILLWIFVWGPLLVGIICGIVGIIF